MAAPNPSEAFTLAGRGLTLETGEDIEQHLRTITDFSKIREVDLSGNTIGVEAASVLGDSFKRMSSLTVANLSNIFTTRSIDEIPLALTSICAGLTGSLTLRQLSLSGNAFGGRVASILVPLLTQTRSIQSLDIDNTGLGPQAGEVLANAILASGEISRSKKEPSNLRVLICGKNRLENSGVAWGKALAMHPNLIAVHMPTNGIPPSGFVAIVEGLAGCPQLRHLSLQDNVARTFDLGGVGTPALVAALPAWRNLTLLNIADCMFTADDFVHLIDAFKRSHHQHTRLETLIVDNSELETANYAQLVQLICGGSWPMLRTLSLVLNEDLESGDVVEIRKELERRGGEVILDDEGDEPWKSPSLQSLGMSKQGDLPAAVLLEDSGVDELADLLGSVVIKP